MTIAVGVFGAGKDSPVIVIRHSKLARGLEQLTVIAVGLGLIEHQDETGILLTEDTVFFQAGLMTVRGFIRGAIFDAALPHVYPSFSLRGKRVKKQLL